MTDYETLMKTMARRIKKFRKMRKMTQVELSRKINKSEKYINGIESCVESMSMKSLVDIANALDVPIGCLLVSSDPKDFTSRINALEEKDQQALEHILSRLEE